MLKKIDSLIWVALTTGVTDIDVDFVARYLKKFQELVFKKISQIDGVLSTETSLMVDLVWEFMPPGCHSGCTWSVIQYCYAGALCQSAGYR